MRSARHPPRDLSQSPATALAAVSQPISPPATTVRYRRRLNKQRGLLRLSERLKRSEQRQHIAVRQASFFLLSQSKIGRASCRERVCQYVKISVVADTLK